ncbi:DNA polymerase III subunit epsilon [Acinetobacter sp. WCHAc060033]|uniref:DNA polymerase III subunit epsilon n=1 Tax=Acinetobacter sp. WCHAc060033 TaxID=2518624 RepID=UPI0010237E40|nr:DNA polymerase III subunit epsilon [Acinetobacter sp. WCHAc060033]RZG88277.1 DNA polymerase III subunit epsilon [Acinetobacter sp. WCHAc060033]
MSQTLTLYVDGACKGNPGPGGWGAYIITPNEEHKLCGGELDTTNNRMELTAAIEGIAFCPISEKLIIWTDSNYVKRGITEWIEGWKKKNWKDVKNPDLWKKLDATCQGREIEWNWIKGHAGHPGNEMADQLANLGTEQRLAGKTTTSITTSPKTGSQQDSIEQQNPIENDKKKIEKDWLLDDPFGFDFVDSEDEMMSNEENQSTKNMLQKNLQVDEQAAVQVDNENNMVNDQVMGLDIEQNETLHVVTNIHPQIFITPATIKLHGSRQFILDTETTGFYYQDSDRIIEVGAIEMINRKLTGSSIHIYINPEKPVGDSEAIHGITDEFLKDKPKYDEIAQVLFDYLKGSEIIAHNASFDMNFLDMEFKRSGLQALSEVCEVTDTLAMAKSKHPGQKNSLDALVRRYEIPQRDRTFHGALLDAEILSDVYLAMTGGQVSFDMDAISEHTEQALGNTARQKIEIEVPVILASAEELEAHDNWIKQFQEKHGEACIFAK